MIKNKYFDYEFDIINYVLDEIENKDELSILCDIDSIYEIMDLIDLDEYKDVTVNIDNDYDIYYMSVFCNMFIIEPAVHDGELIYNSINTLVLDYIEEDYDLFDDVNYEILHLHEESVYIDELTDSEEAEIDLIAECIDSVIKSDNINEVIDEITNLAVKFYNIGFTDFRDAIREFIES